MQEREVVKLNGTAEQVELLYTTGKEGRNDKGQFFTYGLANNRVMFATPALNAVIQGLHPRKGMKLSIQLAEGNRWDVRPIEPPAEQPRQIATASAAPQAAVEQHSNGSTARLPDAPYSSPHSIGRKQRSPGYWRYHCSCGFKGAWYEDELDALIAIKIHLEEKCL